MDIQYKLTLFDVSIQNRITEVSSPSLYYNVIFCISATSISFRIEEFPAGNLFGSLKRLLLFKFIILPIAHVLIIKK